MKAGSFSIFYDPSLAFVGLSRLPYSEGAEGEEGKEVQLLVPLQLAYRSSNDEPFKWPIVRSQRREWLIDFHWTGKSFKERQQENCLRDAALRESLRARRLPLGSP